METGEEASKVAVATNAGFRLDGRNLFCGDALYRGESSEHSDDRVRDTDLTAIR